MKKSSEILLSMVLIIFFSCKHELEKPQWEVNMVIPLMRTNLSINNMMADSLQKVNGDSSVSIIYRTSLYDFLLDSLIKLSDTILSTAVRVDSLKLGTIITDYTYTMSQLFADLGVPPPAQGSPFFHSPHQQYRFGKF